MGSAGVLLLPEAVHAREHGKLLAAAGCPAGDAAPQRDAVFSAEPRIDREFEQRCRVALRRGGL